MPIRTKVHGCIGFTFLLLVACLCHFHWAAAQQSQEEGNLRLTDDQVRIVFSEGWRLLTKIHQNKEGIDTAIQMYEQVRASHPRHPDIYWKLSEMTFKKAETSVPPEEGLPIYDEALSYARKALEIDPYAFEPHFWVGCSASRIAQLSNIIRAAGIIEEAQKELQKAIDINPQHRLVPTAYAILAAIHAQMPWPMQDLDKAETLAEKATDTNPDLTLASLTLAQVLFLREEYNRANAEIERCLSIEQPMYIWDAELYDWPAARKLKLTIESEMNP